MRTVKEFIELARNSPNRLSFGSVGVGTPQHLGGELFKMRAGVDLVHVPFRGATAVLPDLVAGRIDMFIGAVNSLLPLIRACSLRALAATSLARIASLPDVPTLSEAAFPCFEFGPRVGLAAPAASPSDTLQLPNREIGAIIATPGFHQRMALIESTWSAPRPRPMRSSSATTTPNGARWSRRPESSRSEAPSYAPGLKTSEQGDELGHRRR